MDKLTRQIEALKRMTVANGCTPAEAEAAAAKVRQLEAKQPAPDPHRNRVDHHNLLYMFMMAELARTINMAAFNIVVNYEGQPRRKKARRKPKKRRR